MTRSRGHAYDPIRGDSIELRQHLDRIEERLSRLEGRTGNPDFHNKRLHRGRLEKLTSKTGRILELKEGSFHQQLEGNLGDLVLQRSGPTLSPAKGTRRCSA